MKDTSSKPLTGVNTTARFFLIMLISIFTIEMLIMFFLATLPVLPNFWEAILDASLITLALIPILYFLSYRPLLLKNVEIRETSEKLRESFHIQEATSSILELSLQALSLEEHLDRTLDYILSLPWLSLKQMGCIFLVEDEPDLLVMKIRKGLPEDMLRTCSRIPFGTCICGRAAKTGEIIFADTIDDRHEIKYEGISDHGHYCVPISAGKRVLGILNLYVKGGHKENKLEIEFLSSVATALAETIERKRAEEELKKTIKELEHFNGLAVGREKRMIELKSEVNIMLSSMGKEEKYRVHIHERQDDNE